MATSRTLSAVLYMVNASLVMIVTLGCINSCLSNIIYLLYTERATIKIKQNIVESLGLKDKRLQGAAMAR